MRGQAVSPKAEGPGSGHSEKARLGRAREEPTAGASLLLSVDAKQGLQRRALGSADDRKSGTEPRSPSQAEAPG